MHVREAAAPHTELAPQIVGGCYPRQNLNGAQRVVGQNAPQVLNVGTPQDLLRGRSGVRGPEPVGADRHRLFVAPSAASEPYDHLCGDASRRGHVAPRDCVAHHRRPEMTGAQGRLKLELPLSARDRRRTAAFVAHQNACQRRSSGGVNHGSFDDNRRCRGLRRDPVRVREKHREYKTVISVTL